MILYIQGCLHYPFLPCLNVCFLGSIFTPLFFYRTHVKNVVSHLTSCSTYLCQLSFLYIANGCIFLLN